MGVNRVEVYKAIEDGKLGIGIRVNDVNANLQDLLDAWEPLSDDASVYKKYAADGAVCKGCQVNCCHTAYVMPDLIAFKQMAACAGYDYPGFIEHCLQKDKLSAGLLQMQIPCRFLQENVCSIYPVRGLICRFYLCAEVLGQTQQLIYAITLAGITATRVFAEQTGLLPPIIPGGLNSFDRMITRLIEEQRSEEQVRLFLGAEKYADIPLQPFLHGD